MRCDLREARWAMSLKFAVNGAPIPCPGATLEYHNGSVRCPECAAAWGSVEPFIVASKRLIQALETSDPRGVLPELAERMMLIWGEAMRGTEGQ
jgi:hypothetical protein